jgi:GntR family histidine utilization transcriptional repressor
MTINRALRELTDEGLLVRLQGWGRLSRSRKGSRRCLKCAASRRNYLSSSSAPLRGAAAGAQADLIQAAALNVAAGTRIFHSLMVHFENDVPVQIEDRCVNAAWCRTICGRTIPRPRPTTCR